MQTVAELVNPMGFDPVPVWPLAAVARFGPGSAPFGISTDRADLEDLLDRMNLAEPA